MHCHYPLTLDECYDIQSALFAPKLDFGAGGECWVRQEKSDFPGPKPCWQSPCIVKSAYPLCAEQNVCRSHKCRHNLLPKCVPVPINKLFSCQNLANAGSVGAAAHKSRLSRGETEERLSFCCFESSSWYLLTPRQKGQAQRAGKITAAWYKLQCRLTPELVSCIAKQRVECSIPQMYFVSWALSSEYPFCWGLGEESLVDALGLIASASLRGFSLKKARALRSYFHFSDSLSWHRVPNWEGLSHRRFFLLVFRAIHFFTSTYE